MIPLTQRMALFCWALLSHIYLNELSARSASLKRLPKGKRCLKSRVTERGRGDATDVIRVRGPGEAAVQEGKEEGEGADSGRVLPDDRTAPESGHQAAGG